MTISRVLDANPRPRALFQDLSDSLARALAPLFPFHKIVTANEEVHEQEFDVIVTSTQPWRRSTHLHVISFGLIPSCTPFGFENQMYSLTLGKKSLATELSIDPSLSPDLRDLIKRELYPIFRQQSVKQAVQLNFPDVFGTRIPGIEVPPGIVTPFIMAGGDAILAGAFTQSQDSGRSRGGRVWFLPSDVPNPDAWVRLALREFNELDPVRVPSPPDWWVGGQWNTPEQSQARQRISDLKMDRDNFLTENSALIQKAQHESDLSDKAAQDGMLSLLTQDGDILSKVVMEAFVSFGLDVQDMDAIYPLGDKREDLQVTMPDRPGWVALVEVKGYSGGARVTDLARLERHTSRYAAANGGTLPNAKWHVVNTFKAIDPSGRPSAIPNDDELTDFHASGGMLIDTRDLFMAWRGVQIGILDVVQIRGSLFENAMRWTAPTTPN